MRARNLNVCVAIALALVLLAAPAAAQWSPPEAPPVPADPARLLAEAAGPDNPFEPPPCTVPIFNDVPCSNYFSAWINQLYNDQVSTGCPYPNFCPDQPVTRAQMSAFLERAMRGTSTWSPGKLPGNNTGIGDGALYHNSPYAWYNTAIGHNALFQQSWANGNVVYWALNTAIGDSALADNQPDGGDANTNGTSNTAIGAMALRHNTVGYNNTAVGAWAGNTNTQGRMNTFVGHAADVDNYGRVNATAIGYGAVVDDSYKVRIGNTQVTVIGGQVGWTAFSDIRGKKDIADLDLGLDFVMALRPVSYRLKEGNGRTDMGFVAQDIEALLGDDYNVLSIGGDKDRTLALRYTDLIAPVVKAVQEQQAQIAARDDRLRTLESELAELRALVQQLLAQRAPTSTPDPR